MWLAQEEASQSYIDWDEVDGERQGQYDCARLKCGFSRDKKQNVTIYRQRAHPRTFYMSITAQYGRRCSKTILF